MHYTARCKIETKSIYEVTLASDQANVTLRTDSGFFIAKITQLGFYIATSATENLHKKAHGHD